jgi:hypothetical protein
MTIAPNHSLAKISGLKAPQLGEGPLRKMKLLLEKKKKRREKSERRTGGRGVYIASQADWQVRGCGG